MKKTHSDDVTPKLLRVVLEQLWWIYLKFKNLKDGIKVTGVPNVEQTHSTVIFGIFLKEGEICWEIILRFVQILAESSMVQIILVLTI